MGRGNVCRFELCTLEIDDKCLQTKRRIDKNISLFMMLMMFW